VHIYRQHEAPITVAPSAGISALRSALFARDMFPELTPFGVILTSPNGTTYVMETNDSGLHDQMRELVEDDTRRRTFVEREQRLATERAATPAEPPPLNITRVPQRNSARYLAYLDAIALEKLAELADQSIAAVA
jgi:hypothetical protein